MQSLLHVSDVAGVQHFKGMQTVLHVSGAAGLQ